MARPFLLFLLSVIQILPALAGNRQTATGTKTATEIRDGRVVQRFETTPEPNKLPVPLETPPPVQNKSFSPSHVVNSQIRWLSSDAAAIGQDVTVSADGQRTFIGWNLNNMRTSFHNNAHSTTIDATGLATGVYFYRIQSENFTDAKKLVVLK